MLPLTLDDGPTLKNLMRNQTATPTSNRREARKSPPEECGFAIGGAIGAVVDFSTDGPSLPEDPHEGTLPEELGALGVLEDKVDPMLMARFEDADGGTEAGPGVALKGSVRARGTLPRSALGPETARRGSPA